MAVVRSFTALSVVAPAGDRICSGAKTLEVRTWAPDTLPLCDLLIVQNQHRLSSAGPTEDPDGIVIAMVDVVAVREWRSDEVGAACASCWEPGWLAWELHNVRPIISPAKVAARLRLYEVTISPPPHASR